MPTKKNELRKFECEVCKTPSESRDKRSKLCGKYACTIEFNRLNYNKKKHKLNCKRCEREFEGKYKEVNCPECKELPIFLDLEEVERNVLCKSCETVVKREKIKIMYKTVSDNKRGKICCKACLEKSRLELSEARKGDKNVNWNKRGPLAKNWKGGADKYSFIRTGLYREWVYPILKKDNFTCQKCGKDNLKRKTILNVHHSDEKFIDILNKILEIENIPLLKDISEADLLKIRELVATYHVANNVKGITLCEKCHLDEHKKIKPNNIPTLDFTPELTQVHDSKPASSY